MKSPGPHRQFVRNHFLSCDEEPKPLQFLSSSKDISFLSSKSSKLSDKFRKLSIITSKDYHIDFLPRDSMESIGYIKGDVDYPNDEDEDDHSTNDTQIHKLKCKIEKNISYDVIVPGIL